VHLDPQKIALVEESGQTVNYSELNRKANIYASYLHSMGINKNDVVAISLNRSIDMIAILLAVIKLGAIYLAIDPNSPVERRKYLCEDAKVKLHIDQLLNIPHAKEKLDTIDQFRAVTDAFYIVYTSGSTGKPKGVRTTSLAFCNLLCWFTNYYNISCDTRSALVVSEGFDAFGWQLWPYLACGATVYLVSKKTFLNVGKFIEFINTNNISMCFIPTAYVEILINENYLDKIKTLQYLFTGGDRLNTFLPKPYPFKVMNHYGVSEGAVVSTFCEVPVIEQGKSISEKSSGNKPLIGKPIDNTEIYILDAKRQPVPIGIWGELCIGGLGVSSGYINDSILSAHKFVKKNFSLGPCSEGEILYLTGDRARFLNDGNIEYLNRLDNQIEIHGYRIEPAEIENLLLENAKINQAAVVLHEDNESKQLIAYVVLKNNIHDFVDTDTLIDNLKNKLSLEMIPKHIVILDKLPVTENGKIDRLCLAKKPIFVQGHKNFQNVEIANKLYGDILDIFSKLLGIPQESLNIDKSFFELGGDSIGALKLLNIIKKEFNVSVPISDIYANSSNVSSLVFTILKHRPQKKVITKTYNAKTAADSLNNSYDLVATLRSGDNSQPLFFIHPAGGTVFVYQKLISLLDKNQTCYGIQYPLDEKYEFNLPKNIQELAAFYVDLIRHVQPRGPYAVIGYSFGGMLAYEIAYQLYKSGQKIAMIGILDTLVVSVLDQRTKQKLKHNVIQNYEKQYEETFVENPMAETTFMHMQNIGFAYQPPCFAGEIDLFKAKAQAQILIGIQDDTNFWSRFSKVNVHYVPGNHDTILEKENVEQLASELAACITSAKIKGARL